ncbi:MAG: DUF2341 domain-containing protein, partial [Kiritimatiellae bacterium]|nr:DUF2341 domain-containing protein [Kiritimatiellia bacterium]
MKFIRLALAALVAATLFFPASADAEPAVGYSAQFTISGYAGLTTLENFPVLVRLSSNSPKGFAYADCAADGSDIYFTDASGAVLAHEIDTWNTSGESLVWVSVPEVKPVAEGATAFTMHYAAEPPEEVASLAPSAVWSNAGYKSVWHLDIANNSTADSVAGYTGTVLNPSAYCGAGEGLFGGGYSCTDNLDQVHAVKTTSVAGFTPTTASVATYSVWVRQVGGTAANNAPDAATYPKIKWASEWGNCGAVVNSKNGQHGETASGIELCLEGKANQLNTMVVRDSATTTAALTLDTIYDKAWHYLVLRYDGVRRQFFVDGVEQTAFAANCTFSNPSGTVRFGGRSDASKDCVWTGDIDELRFRAAAASDDWIAAEYAQVLSGTFLTAEVPHAICSVAHINETSARITATVASNGDGEACDLYVAYGTDAGNLPAFEKFATGVAAGESASTVLSGLVSGETYHYAVLASNENDRVSATIGSFRAGIDFPRPDIQVAEFSRGVKFTVAGYAGTQVLTNFPVLVRLAAGSPAGFSYGDFFSAAGDDLCFLDAEGNGIPHEIDTWNTSGESLVWVTLPRLTNGTEFAMWYRSSASGSVVCGKNAWTDYTGVWHLGGSGDGVQYEADSTTNALTATTHANSLAVASGAVGAARRVSTKTGGSAANGRIFVDLADAAKRAAVDALAADGSEKTFTASFWFCPRGNADWCYLIGRKEDDKYAAWGVQ